MGKDNQNLRSSYFFFFSSPKVVATKHIRISWFVLPLMLLDNAFPTLQGGYVKDDFFDSLSSNALDSNLHNGKTKLSERMKMDAKVIT